jgi:hypothetical protein
MTQESYKKVAKELGVRHLFGRWGVSFHSQMPEGHKVWRVRFIPLDGWITDPKEVERIMRERGLEL